jgi:hypothetical protein
MHAGNVTGANGVYANRAFTTKGLFSFPTVNGAARPVSAGGIGNILRKCKSGAAGSILFESMVLFNDFDIIILTKHAGHFSNQLEQQIHPKTHIACLDNADAPGGGLNILLLSGCKAGSA